MPIVELISSTGAVTVASVTFNSSSSLTATTNLLRLICRVENNDGGAVRSSSAILNVSIAPNWSTRNT